MTTQLFTPRRIWFFLALLCAGLAAGSIVLTAWQDLHPCHLCIFQRLLYLLLALLLALAGALAPHPAARWLGFSAMPLAAAGLVTAVYQSGLQMQPPGSVSCAGGEPGLIEQLVEWLGQAQPELFLATGFCEEAELTILNLTLANWSLIGFAACLAGIYLAWRRPKERLIFKH